VRNKAAARLENLGKPPLSIAPRVWQSGEVDLEAPLCNRDRHHLDLFLTIMQKIVPVLPRRMSKADYVGRNIAPVTYPVEKNLGLRAGSRLDRSPKGTDTGFEFREHANEIGSLEVFVRRFEVSRTWPFTKSTRVACDFRRQAIDGSPRGPILSLDSLDPLMPLKAPLRH